MDKPPLPAAAATSAAAAGVPAVPAVLPAPTVFIPAVHSPMAQGFSPGNLMGAGVPGAAVASPTQFLTLGPPGLPVVPVPPLAELSPLGMVLPPAQPAVVPYILQPPAAVPTGALPTVAPGPVPAAGPPPSGLLTLSPPSSPAPNTSSPAAAGAPPLVAPFLVAAEVPAAVVAPPVAAPPVATMPPLVASAPLAVAAVPTPTPAAPPPGAPPITIPPPAAIVPPQLPMPSPGNPAAAPPPPSERAATGAKPAPKPRSKSKSQPKSRKAQTPTAAKRKSQTPTSKRGKDRAVPPPPAAAPPAAAHFMDAHEHAKGMQLTATGPLVPSAGSPLGANLEDAFGGFELRHVGVSGLYLPTRTFRVESAYVAPPAKPVKAGTTDGVLVNGESDVIPVNGLVMAFWQGQQQKFSAYVLAARRIGGQLVYDVCYFDDNSVERLAARYVLPMAPAAAARAAQRFEVAAALLAGKEPPQPPSASPRPPTPAPPSPTAAAGGEGGAPGGGTCGIVPEDNEFEVEQSGWKFLSSFPPDVAKYSPSDAGVVVAATGGDAGGGTAAADGGAAAADDDLEPLSKRQRRTEVTLGAVLYLRSIQTQELDPLTMVECLDYLDPEVAAAAAAAASARRSTMVTAPAVSQPFDVHVMPEALLLCDFHAHLASTEIIGFLAGTWNAETRRVCVRASFPCRALARVDDAHVNVEMDPASEIEVRSRIEARNLRVVGWYHSHPNFQPTPSIRDIQNQDSYQYLFKDQAASMFPFVGIIVSPYDPKLPTPHSNITYFNVTDPPCPMRLSVHQESYVEVKVGPTPAAAPPAAGSVPVPPLHELGCGKPALGDLPVVTAHEFLVPVVEPAVRQLVGQLAPVETKPAGAAEPAATPKTVAPAAKEPAPVAEPAAPKKAPSKKPAAPKKAPSKKRSSAFLEPTPPDVDDKPVMVVPRLNFLKQREDMEAEEVAAYDAVKDLHSFVAALGNAGSDDELLCAVAGLHDLVILRGRKALLNAASMNLLTRLCDALSMCQEESLLVIEAFQCVLAVFASQAKLARDATRHFATTGVVKRPVARKSAPSKPKPATSKPKPKPASKPASKPKPAPKRKAPSKAAPPPPTVHSLLPRKPDAMSTTTSHHVDIVPCEVAIAQAAVRYRAALVYVRRYGARMSSLAAQIVDLCEYYRLFKSRVDMSSKWKKASTTRLVKVRDALAAHVERLPIPASDRAAFLDDTVKLVELSWVAPRLSRGASVAASPSYTDSEPEIDFGSDADYNSSEDEKPAKRQRPRGQPASGGATWRQKRQAAGGEFKYSPRPGFEYDRECIPTGPIYETRYLCPCGANLTQESYVIKRHRSTAITHKQYLEAGGDPHAMGGCIAASEVEVKPRKKAKSKAK